MAKEFDVIVCGAGVAGVAAATEAARSGLSVALVEKTILTGGLATAGLIFVYEPLCDGSGTQVIYGLAEEMLLASVLYGPGDIPEGWVNPRTDTRKGRYRVVFSPASLTLALDEILINSGVHIWLDTLACVPVMHGNKVAGVEVETKAGRETLLAPVTIDATGDADIAWRSGAPCESGLNIMSIWALEAALTSAEAAAAKGNGKALLDMFARGGDSVDPEIESPERHWTVNSAEEISAFVLEGRKILLQHYKEAQAKVGRDNVFPLTLPTQAQYRMTRRIVNASTMATGEEWKRKAGSIGLAPDWRAKDCVWEVPYGALVPDNVDGLLVAGRCIASRGDAWHVTRVIPVAAMTGQVAGIAAVLAVRERVKPAALMVERIWRELDAKGMPYRIDDVYDKGYRVQG